MAPEDFNDRDVLSALEELERIIQLENQKASKTLRKATALFNKNWSREDLIAIKTNIDSKLEEINSKLNELQEACNQSDESLERLTNIATDISQQESSLQQTLNKGATLLVNLDSEIEERKQVWTELETGLGIDITRIQLYLREIEDKEDDLKKLIQKIEEKEIYLKTLTRKIVAFTKWVGGARPLNELLIALQQATQQLQKAQSPSEVGVQDMELIKNKFEALEAKIAALEGVNSRPQVNWISIQDQSGA